MPPSGQFDREITEGGLRTAQRAKVRSLGVVVPIDSVEEQEVHGLIAANILIANRPAASPGASL